ncbi:MAG: MCE family protein [Thermoleophilaceae bacterium]|nr:MCE family protein [Thermoleophilaceae bacterium]
MRRIVGIALAIVAVPLVLVVGLGASGGGGSGYEVRAIFDYVRAVPGEDVKISGARVGTIKSLDVTKDQKAVVVFSVEKGGFTPFHTDAHCSIRSQSLIGETFVECQPGTRSKPELARIPDGQPGAGQHLLPLANTSSPIDIDLINDIWRLPIRQRLAIIINEFGAGLAGRGADLNEVVHRANPALRETDKVLAILASQNRTLARLARDSDRSLAPLARQRKRFAHFIQAANETAQASAERRADISRSFERLPRLLQELRPTLADLRDFAGQATPVVSDLRRAAPGLSTFFQKLKPFSEESVPAFRTLGTAADVGRRALDASQPTLAKLARFASDARPVARNLSALATSLDRTKAIDNLMLLVYHGTTSINGFDEISHFLRAALVVNTCATYATVLVPSAGCSANFTVPRSVQAASGPSDPALAGQRQAIAAMSGGGAGGGSGSAGSQAGAGPSAGDPALLRQLLAIVAPKADPQAEAERKRVVAQIQRGAKSMPRGVETGDPAQPVLDYLLGNDR